MGFQFTRRLAVLLPRLRLGVLRQRSFHFLHSRDFDLPDSLGRYTELLCQLMQRGARAVDIR